VRSNCPTTTDFSTPKLAHFGFEHFALIFTGGMAFSSIGGGVVACLFFPGTFTIRESGTSMISKVKRADGVAL